MNDRLPNEAIKNKSKAFEETAERSNTIWNYRINPYSHYCVTQLGLLLQTSTDCYTNARHARHARHDRHGYTHTHRYANSD